MIVNEVSVTAHDDSLEDYAGEISLHSSSPLLLETEGVRKQCWICLATDEDDENVVWKTPCICQGSAKWVHLHCLERWIDEKQKGNSMNQVSCPQCNIPYVVILPSLGYLEGILEAVEQIIYEVSPFLAVGAIISCFYWSAITYGAITVMQLVGHIEGLTFMEHSDPLFLLFGLPSIPVALILIEMIDWEEQILLFLRRNVHRTILLRTIFPLFNVSDNSMSFQCSGETNLPVTNSPTRILCGALLLPTIANLCGRIIFENIQNNFHRTLIGGFTFLAIRGILKIYYQQKRYIRHAQRKIMDFSVKN